MKAKTMRLTVICPYCETPATFRNQERMREWRDKGETDPVHTTCKNTASHGVLKAK